MFSSLQAAIKVVFQRTMTVPAADLTHAGENKCLIGKKITIRRYNKLGPNIYVTKFPYMPVTGE